MAKEDDGGEPSEPLVSVHERSPPEPVEDNVRGGLRTSQELVHPLQHVPR
ncbi:hypothetical protein [Luteococcus sp. OSA5]